MKTSASQSEYFIPFFLMSISSETNICYKSYLLRTIISRKNIRQMEYEEDNMDTLRTIKIRFEIGLELVLS